MPPFFCQTGGNLTVTGDLVIQSGSFLDLSLVGGRAAVDGSILLHGQGDLRKVTSVGGNVHVDGSLGPHTFPAVAVVPGDLRFYNSGTSGSS